LESSRKKPSEKWASFIFGHSQLGEERLKTSVNSGSHGPPRVEWTARHTRSGVAGISMWRTPNSESASTSAFITDGRAPAQPASPQPGRRAGSLWPARNEIHA